MWRARSRQTMGATDNGAIYIFGGDDDTQPVQTEDGEVKDLYSVAELVKPLSGACQKDVAYKIKDYGCGNLRCINMKGNIIITDVLYQEMITDKQSPHPTPQGGKFHYSTAAALAFHPRHSSPNHYRYNSGMYCDYYPELYCKQKINGFLHDSC